MRNWENLLVSEKTTLKEVMGLFEKNGAQIAIIANENHTLLGVVTDGDIRRGILSNMEINGPVKEIMSTSPITVTKSTPERDIFQKFKILDTKYLPIVDENKIIRGVYSRSDFVQSSTNDNPVVIMAGGEGLRLRPLTENLPKPMVGINGTPIIERLLINLITQGFSKFFLSINYLGEIIESYFGNGKKWGVDISYLKEDKKLGTGGSLKLLKEIDNDLIILNGDLVTNINFKLMLDHHKKESACVTIGVQKSIFRIPYGVVNCTDMMVQSLEEKPILTYNANCGIYSLAPKALDAILGGESIDMPCLINRLLNKKEKVIAFPIYEEWQDIGNIHDLERVRSTYSF